MKKSLGNVAELATLLMQLASVQAALNYEALIEANGSELPARLKAAIVELSDVLKALVDEETAEMIEGKAATAEQLHKRAEARVAKQAAPIFALLAQLLKSVKAIEAQPMPGGPARTHLPYAIEPEPAGAGRVDAILGNLSPGERDVLVSRLVMQPTARAP